MALTDDDKLLRRKVVAEAIRRLREHMGISQTQLGRLIDEGAANRSSVTDGGSVSRWERGEILPHEWKRKELLRIARKNGRNDLANLLEDPQRNWREMILSRDRQLFQLITLLEICALNKHFFGDDRSDFFNSEMLRSMVDGMCFVLKHEFSPKNPPILLDDYQRELWRQVSEGIEKRLEAFDSKLEGDRRDDYDDGETNKTTR